MMTLKDIAWVVVLGVVSTPSSGLAEWQSHEVRQLNGMSSRFQLSARFQIVTESWNRVVAVPSITYMPDEDRLLMLVGCDYPHRAFVLTSDDRGATWTDPRPARPGEDGKPSIGMGTGLAYLGNGKLIFYESGGLAVGQPCRWFSSDHGHTWGNPVPLAGSPDGKTWNIWDPPLIDRDPKTGHVTRIVETGYNSTNGVPRAYIRSSYDTGQTWSKATTVPQWHHANEVFLFRAGNGQLVAACRTDIPARMEGKTLDHYEGLGTSLSNDDGRTWSAIRQLYDYGRHHPSLLLMPNNDIVMTYVTRLGYIDDKHGLPQFGIEAVVSHDNGVTWDLDHRYLLHVWSGNQKGATYWWPSSQATSSMLMPDGTIVTAFGTGYRIQVGPDNLQGPRDVGLIEWRLNTKRLNAETSIREAASDSDLRNVFDPNQ